MKLAMPRIPKHVKKINGFILARDNAPMMSGAIVAEVELNTPSMPAAVFLTLVGYT